MQDPTPFFRTPAKFSEGSYGAAFTVRVSFRPCVVAVVAGAVVRISEVAETG